MALSDAHPILQIDATQPLAVCGATLNGDRGLFDLVDTWPRVLDRFPKPDFGFWETGSRVDKSGNELSSWNSLIRLSCPAFSMIFPIFSRPQTFMFIRCDRTPVADAWLALWPPESARSPQQRGDQGLDHQECQWLVDSTWESTCHGRGNSSGTRQTTIFATGSGFAQHNPLELSDLISIKLFQPI